MRGDANRDALVDVGDCVLILRFYSGDTTSSIDSVGKLNADVNGDGNVTDSDADRILKYVARLVEKL